MKPRKSLAEFAAEAAKIEQRDGFLCPSCGCNDWRVRISRLRAGYRQRERICRHCGYPLLTIEIPLSNQE